MLIEKSIEFNIDLNAKDKEGKTVFLDTCKHSYSIIAEMLIRKSNEFNIDLNGLTNFGGTPFHLACL